MQAPSWQIFSYSSHSFRSSQELVSGFRVFPLGHSHLNDPTVLTHVPPLQRPGTASHSSISKI